MPVERGDGPYRPLAPEIEDAIRDLVASGWLSADIAVSLRNRGIYISAARVEECLKHYHRAPRSRAEMQQAAEAEPARQIALAKRERETAPRYKFVERPPSAVREA